MGLLIVGPLLWSVHKLLNLLFHIRKSVVVYFGLTNSKQPSDCPLTKATVRLKSENRLRPLCSSPTNILHCTSCSAIFYLPLLYSSTRPLPTHAPTKQRNKPSGRLRDTLCSSQLLFLIDIAVASCLLPRANDAGSSLLTRTRGIITAICQSASESKCDNQEDEE